MPVALRSAGAGKRREWDFGKLTIASCRQLRLVRRHRAVGWPTDSWKGANFWNQIRLRSEPQCEGKKLAGYQMKSKQDDLSVDLLAASDRKRRQSWMVYVVYFFVAIVALNALAFIVTLNETRQFIGNGGLEICWKYQSFERYLWSSSIELAIACCILFALYWMAVRNYLRLYLIAWGFLIFARVAMYALELTPC